MNHSGPPAAHTGTGEDEGHHALLRSVVRTAVAIFDARAGSIALLDQDSGELVFEAVAGEGEGALVGRRFPAERGIAGWVLQSRQPVEVHDVDSDAHFARDFAESTSYVPKALMAAPLLCGDEPLGVLEVLDRSTEPRTPLAAMELLALFADQASLALVLVQRARRARPVGAGPAGPAEAAAQALAGEISALDGGRREIALRIVSDLTEVLHRRP
ncbi:GAF domain-containing protein [Streptomyces alfalfae]|uniref:GAF domain-containing protein n=1 Tax=Streptomyces alfalfae TaxID=1642299 RepID=UPI0009A18DD9|nr:GAF domain-containing protein [Streptomyces alfalfae]AYA15624.1 GAF domain-containing protein [Streptomyces fradiae]RXX39100.1 GAF domain-containing protein [Streptomyces alfalfae]RZN00175.1 GAF domain-containing protein [Streptomyces alfalfae]